jgi:hypothetical protein
MGRICSIRMEIISKRFIERGESGFVFDARIASNRTGFHRSFSEKTGDSEFLGVIFGFGIRSSHNGLNEN